MLGQQVFISPFNNNDVLLSEPISKVNFTFIKKMHKAKEEFLNCS